LTQTEKLAALGQFVAGIAHELNNPLQGVLGHLELLRTTGAFPKQLRREVQTIYREAERAAKIVRSLLVFAGSRRLARRSVSVNAILQKVLALRATACRAADIEVVRHYDEHLPRVQSDPLLLHQVFLNVVMNAEHAVAATRHAGRIEITTMLNQAGDRIVAGGSAAGRHCAAAAAAADACRPAGSRAGAPACARGGRRGEHPGSAGKNAGAGRVRRRCRARWPIGA